VRTAWTSDGPDHAPPLLLLHSLGSDSSMWDPQARALAGDHRVVRLDTRGHGAAPAPPGPYTLADLGRDVVDVADALGLGTFHLAGLSLGGLTALWVAVHHGDRLRSLTAANTAARVGSAAGWQDRIDAVRRHGLTGIRDDVLARFFAPGFATAQPAAWAQAQRAFVAADDDGYAACCAALADADLRDDVGRITTPTLVVGGREDLATPPDQAEDLAAAVPGSRLVVLDGAAHLSNLDRPEAFTEALRQHLDTVEHHTADTG
jgi:3-oxoadipate enol-lactonase